MKTLLVVMLLRTTLSLTAQSTGAVNNNRPSSDWNKLVDGFFDEYFKLHPSQGTSAGFHQYDSELEDYSSKGVNDEIAFANHYLDRVNKFDPSLLPVEEQQDREMILNSVNSTLLDLQKIKGWEKNPDRYSSGITQSAFTIMSRKFAPPEKRLHSLIEREKKMPEVFAAARSNLKNPPRVYTQVAIQQLPGLISFFQKDVPAAFNDVKDAQLLAEFQQSNARIIAALQQYEKFLKESLLPNSNGDFRIGTDNYQKKLLYDEMVDIPLDQLLQIGYDDLHRNQEWFKKVAAQIGLKKTPQQSTRCCEVGWRTLIDSNGGLRKPAVQSNYSKFSNLLAGHRPRSRCMWRPPLRVNRTLSIGQNQDVVTVTDEIPLLRSDRANVSMALPPPNWEAC